MGRHCTICIHPSRGAIEEAMVAGTSCGVIASKFVGITSESLQRHRKDHLPEALRKSPTAEEMARGDELVAEVHRLKEKAYSLLEQAEKGGDIRTALQGVRECRGCLELLMKAREAEELGRRLEEMEERIAAALPAGYGRNGRGHVRV